MAVARAAKTVTIHFSSKSNFSTNRIFYRGQFSVSRGSVVGMVQSVSRPEELINSQSEQNLRPTGRMRGSLDLEGRQYPDVIRQRIIAPTQPVQSSSSKPQPVQKSSVSP
ncbi:hypothetical protein SESBI_26412 [Sesbania bispinosa]|nr:hypothetical protein SESBI_26412 [Sesbania bispinosa]